MELPEALFRSSRVTPTKQPDVPTYVQKASIRAVELLQQLAPEAGIAVEHVAVPELVGREAVGLLDDLLRALHHPRDELGRDPLWARDDLDLRSERAHGQDLLVRERVRGHDPERIALERTHVRERRPRAPARVLDHGLARLQPTVSLGALDHRERHAVLVRAGRVGGLELDPDLGHARLDEPLDPDDRRRADRPERALRTSTGRTG